MDSETQSMATKRENAVVIRHQESSDGKHAVDAQLRVLILPSEDGGYVAQGLEIDYLTTGQTVEEVRENFAQGLLRTIEAYIKRNRPLDALFTKGKTPAEAWGLWLDSESKDVLTCGTVVALDIPDDTKFFKTLSFREAEIAHAA
ncbi:type II toxin-antitoxin system HicB family antitoxin [Stenotrophomonas sp.]|uniref:type II toxin-antitoxin system HicB family antitoxin n=1 Tax=Stenotrophomonas sp. TaxID=69392 RepID=UPI0028A990E2|nr:type II toxin-antitoxin system HicB family antitoxin [Stenotrophomonas sp.]